MSESKNEEVKNEEVKNEEVKNEEVKNEEVKNEEVKKIEVKKIEFKLKGGVKKEGVKYEKVSLDVDAQFRELAALELEFHNVEMEILRSTVKKQAPLFERRNKTTSRIPGFWPHVWEDAASQLGFDEHISPEDAECISAMTSFNVTRPHWRKGDPRDLKLSFTFADNTYMPAQTITKRFTYQGVMGLTGIVSEPVEIKWKEGKDLTEGINKAAIEAFKERQLRAGNPDKKETDPIGEKEKHLAKLLEKHTSFFNWFSFTNCHEELGEVVNNAPAPRTVDGLISPVEAFPYGDEIAIQLADDVYPGAVKYFTEALQVNDDNSDEESDIDLDSEQDEAELKQIIGSSGKNEVKESPKKSSKRSCDSGDDDESDGDSKKSLKRSSGDESEGPSKKKLKQ